MNDDLKNTISYSPATRKIHNGRIFRLDFSNDMSIKVRPCLFASMLILLISLFLIAIALYAGLEKKEIIPMLFGGFMGAFIVFSFVSILRNIARFDLINREFIRWGQRIPLNDVAALQIIEKIGYTKSGQYSCWELNLVLKSGERTNILYGGNQKTFMEEAQQLSQMLGLPIWTKDEMLSPDKITQKAQTFKRQNKPGAYLAVGILFLILPSFFLFACILLPLQNMLQSRNWQACPAVVTHSALDSRVSHSSKGGRTQVYKIDIRADFQYKGQKYTCTTYDFFMSKSYTNVGVKNMKKTIAAHPVGKNITCYVNPDFPQKSVINNKDIPLATLFHLLFCGLFLLVGFFLIYMYFQTKKQANEMKLRQFLNP